jgi:alpha-beta hydrolase superfamily lysophospholipase
VDDGVTEPRLDAHPADGDTVAVALFCHGGTVASVEPPRERALSVIRMRAVEQFVSSAAAGRGLTTYLLRYRVAGWNGTAADAHADVRWALERIRAEHGDVPIVLVGHSMGGRAVLRAGGEAQVGLVCALAPWTPPGEPVDHLRDRTVVIVHGRGDRWVPAPLSADFARRAHEAGAHVARFTVAGGHSMLRRAYVWHTFVRDVVLAGAGLAPMRPDVADALARPAPGGLAVNLGGRRPGQENSAL